MWQHDVANQEQQADMVELADTLDLGSNAERCKGSSPFICTMGSHLPTVDDTHSEETTKEWGQ